MPNDEDTPPAEPEAPHGAADTPTSSEIPHDDANGAGGRDRRSVSRLQLDARKHEDTELAALVRAWVADKWPDANVKRTFIETELEAKIGSYRTQARAWRAAQVLIWLLIAVLGLLVSVFAGFKTGHGFTIIAGALVATLTTLTNATHPSKQADGYLTARLALRDEGWSLLNRTGDYAGLDDDGRYEHFVDAVHKIVLTKRTSTNLDALTA